MDNSLGRKWRSKKNREGLAGGGGRLGVGGQSPATVWPGGREVAKPAQVKRQIALASADFAATVAESVAAIPPEIIPPNGPRGVRSGSGSGQNRSVGVLLLLFLLLALDLDA